MADYVYTPEMREVMTCLRSIKKTYGLRNTWREALNPRHVPVLRQAYVTAMRMDLYNLHSALDAFWAAGGRVVGTDWMDELKDSTTGGDNHAAPT